MVKRLKGILNPRLEVSEQTDESAIHLTNKAKLSLYKKSVNSGISADILEEVYYRGYTTWNESFDSTPEQFGFDRVNSFIAGGFAAEKLDADLMEKVKKPTGKLKDACWTGYTAVGMKMKGGRKVPNCVPVKEEVPNGETVSSNSDDASSRFIGSDSLTKVYSEMTPGQTTKSVIKKIVREKIENDAQHHRDEKEMAKTQLKAIAAKANNLASKLKGKELEAWMQYKINNAKDGVTAVNDVMTYREEVEVDEDWQAAKHKNPSGGLKKSGVMAYRREHPGSKLKTAVTTKPSKLKKGSKAWNRRKSFCARMGGMKKRLTSAKTAHDPDSRINKALRKWNCE